MPGVRDAWGALGGSWVKGTRGSPGADATTSWLQGGPGSLQQPPSTPVSAGTLSTLTSCHLCPAPARVGEKLTVGHESGGRQVKGRVCTSSRGCRSVYFIFQDGKIEAEDFTSRLYRELNSSPQPYLVPFLKVSVRPLDRLGCSQASEWGVVGQEWGLSCRRCV